MEPCRGFHAHARFLTAARHQGWYPAFLDWYPGVPPGYQRLSLALPPYSTSVPNIHRVARRVALVVEEVQDCLWHGKHGTSSCLCHCEHACEAGLLNFFSVPSCFRIVWRAFWLRPSRCFTFAICDTVLASMGDLQDLGPVDIGPHRLDIRSQKERLNPHHGTSSLFAGAATAT